ncbi:hypothetical protein [Corynebacterium pygosceleis]|uniref:Secreted protein n=1 Tax=Corynebacterium pygosceleis TaxID=2800406 RepID=A0A9Q4C8R7_9CORY|nr:hypothetical protein [Corynebacterium pygosceleis]MCK7638081.1 hypothetical protein [Corynebacterium pygosceleis]MCK7675794.1 hypothetical protein [Corynebacterium pygosceleis]MCX7444364.1 hypothetical protein [Corynebacterium pygosceleis]MCX7468797.1 hypothetical protein [Corynebacterium pygosceleis]
MTTTHRRSPAALIAGTVLVCTAACTPAGTSQETGTTDAPILTATHRPAPRDTGEARGVVIYFSPESPATGNTHLRDTIITDAAHRAGVTPAGTDARAVDHTGELSVVVTVDGGLDPGQLARFTTELYAEQGITHVEPDTGSAPSGGTVR